MPPSRASAAPCGPARASSTPRRSARSRSSGPDAAEFLNRLYVNDFSGLAPGRSRYGILLRDDGFIYDDGVIARLAPDRFHVTTTTGGAARVLAMMEDYRQTEWTDLEVWLTSVTEQWAVIAVQGPLRAAGARAARAGHRPPAVLAAAHGGRRGTRRGRAGTGFSRELHRRARLRDQRAGGSRPQRVGGRLRGGRSGRHHALRHRNDARAARGEGLHHRRPGHRRHGDAARRRPRLGDRPEETGLRRQALARARRDAVAGPQAARRPAHARCRHRARGRRADHGDARAVGADEGHRARHVVVSPAARSATRLRSRWSRAAARAKGRRSTCRCRAARSRSR